MSNKQYIDQYDLVYPYYDQYKKYVKKDMENQAHMRGFFKTKAEKGRNMMSELLDNNTYTDIVESIKTDRAQRYAELVTKLVDVGLVDPSSHPDTVQEILISLIEGK